VRLGDARRVRVGAGDRAVHARGPGARASDAALAAIDVDALRARLVAQGALL